MDPIKSSIFDVLRRRPWLTTREILRELDLEGVSDVSRHDVNTRLYSSHEDFLSDESTPRRWRTRETISADTLEEELLPPE